MKLKTLSLVALFISMPIIVANQSGQEMADIVDADLEQSAEDIAMIEYRVMLYKDRTENGHDAQAWESVLQKTTKSLRVVDQGDAWADAVADVFNAARGGLKDGIHGEISVSMSDGNESDCCGSECNCAMRYKGNCPCSLRNELCSACEDDEELEDEMFGEDELFLLDEEEVSEASCGACNNLISKK